MFGYSNLRRVVTFARVSLFPPSLLRRAQCSACSRFDSAPLHAAACACHGEHGAHAAAAAAAAPGRPQGHVRARPRREGRGLPRRPRCRGSCRRAAPRPTHGLKAMSRAAARQKETPRPGQHLALAATASGGSGSSATSRWRSATPLPSLRGVVATDAVVGFAIDRCAGGDLNSLRRRQAGLAILRRRHPFLRSGAGARARAPARPRCCVPRPPARQRPIQGSGHIMLVDFDLSTSLPPPLPPPPPDANSPSPAARFRLIPHVAASAKQQDTGLRTLLLSPGSLAESSSSSSYHLQKGLSRLVIVLLLVARRADDAGGRTRSSGRSTTWRPRSWPGAGTTTRSIGGASAWCSTRCCMGARRSVAGAGGNVQRVLTAQPELPGEPTPLRDLIARLLEKDSGKRLGANGVKRHAFFRGVCWDRVLDVARPPFIPVPDDDSAGSGAEGETLDVEKVVRETFALSATRASEEKHDGGDSDFSIFF
ncbi:hypothetical protein ZWY2020_037830 [Hordeum vulgare]|nr:hypothetical protein ZWY2020_037830 [Hordeum vulgare]